MALDAGSRNGACFEVEVLGWDVQESLFVETTTMKSDGPAVAKVYLHRPLSTNTLVFVRVTNSSVSDGSSPLAYRPNEVRIAPRWHLYEVSLTPMRRRSDWILPDLDAALAWLRAQS